MCRLRWGCGWVSGWAGLLLGWFEWAHLSINTPSNNYLTIIYTLLWRSKNFVETLCDHDFVTFVIRSRMTVHEALDHAWIKDDHLDLDKRIAGSRYLGVRTRIHDKYVSIASEYIVMCPIVYCTIHIIVHIHILYQLVNSPISLLTCVRLCQ